MANFGKWSTHAFKFALFRSIVHLIRQYPTARQGHEGHRQLTPRPWQK